MDKKEFENFSKAINTAIESSIQILAGNSLTDALVEQFAELLNNKVGEVYKLYDVNYDYRIDRNFANHIINHLMDQGIITFKSEDYSHTQDIKPSDPEAHSPKLLDDANDYDPAYRVYQQPFHTIVDDEPQVQPAYDQLTTSGAERSEHDYVFVEFYDIIYPDRMGSSYKQVEATFKFYGLESAREFVNLNGYCNTFKSKYFEVYAFRPTTTYDRVKITL